MIEGTMVKNTKLEPSLFIFGKPTQNYLGVVWTFSYATNYWFRRSVSNENFIP